MTIDEMRRLTRKPVQQEMFGAGAVGDAFRLVQQRGVDWARHQNEARARELSMSSETQPPLI